VREPLIEEESTFRGQSESLSTVEFTPENQTQPSAQKGDNATLKPNPRSQLTQRVSNHLGAPVQLTDGQFQVLLERLTSADASFTPPTVHDSPNSPQPHRTQGSKEGDPEDSFSDSTSRRSIPRRLQKISLRLEKRSLKHDDPNKLDDGTFLIYASWCILLEGKLLANAD
jgi:hypothetical protein